ncbi:transmembrane protein 212 [Xenopus laevis]|uniref:Transmembrane protein 212 n=2 Tax=Xenopus laevis TaxID=8355 RepID=A0A974CWP3_XENLA|nr:transmembrane protein 212 [Xenopus laevis]OCT80767.1 hypothetical protein XELAEV_18027579mg [Xenopus laevis]
MASVYQIAAGCLIAFGLLSISSGILGFFPVFSNKPLFIGWSIRIACPIWNGALALIVGILTLLAYREWTKKSLWEATFMFTLLSVIGTPVQLVLAIASILIGPYCYYTFAGSSSTNYIGYAIKFPFPYAKFPNVCTDPYFYQWYYLILQIINLVSGVIILCSSLAIAIKLAARIIRSGTLNGQKHAW